MRNYNQWIIIFTVTGVSKRSKVAFLCYFLAQWCYFLFLGNQEKNVLFFLKCYLCWNILENAPFEVQNVKIFLGRTPKSPYCSGDPSWIHTLATERQTMLLFAHHIVLRQQWLVLRQNEPWTPLAHVFKKRHNVVWCPLFSVIYITDFSISPTTHATDSEYGKEFIKWRIEYHY